MLFYGPIEELRTVDRNAARAFGEFFTGHTDFRTSNTVGSAGDPVTKIVGMSGVFVEPVDTSSSGYGTSEATLVVPGPYQYIDHYRDNIGLGQDTMPIDLSEGVREAIIENASLRLIEAKKRLLGGFVLFADNDDAPNYSGGLFVSPSLVDEVLTALEEQAHDFDELPMDKQSETIDLLPISEAEFRLYLQKCKSRDDSQWTKSLHVIAGLLPSPQLLSHNLRRYSAPLN